MPKDVDQSTEEETSFNRVMTLKKRHGKCGSYTYDDGSYFVGDFDADGVKSGVGHLEMGNGATYDGGFAKGLPNGAGVMRFPDSSRYEGELMQGWFHGHGVYTTIGGMRFEGEFRGGRIWGNGRMTFNDGKTISEGYFQDSRFSRDGDADEAVRRARKVADYARKVCAETTYDGGDDGWRREASAAAATVGGTDDGAADGAQQQQE